MDMNVKNIVVAVSLLFLSCIISTSDFDCESELEPEPYSWFPETYDVRLFGNWNNIDTVDTIGWADESIYFTNGGGALYDFDETVTELKWYLNEDSIITYVHRFPTEVKESIIGNVTHTHNWFGPYKMKYNYINDSTLIIYFYGTNSTDELDSVVDSATYNRVMPDSLTRMFFGEWIIDSVVDSGNGHMFNYYNFMLTYSKVVPSTNIPLNLIIDSVKNTTYYFNWGYSSYRSWLAVNAFSYTENNLKKEKCLKKTHKFLTDDRIEFSLIEFVSSDTVDTTSEIKIYKKINRGK